MQTFSGFEYLLIDAANKFGFDDQTWDYRINWSLDGLKSGFPEATDAKEPMLYRKALRAIDQARRGETVHHMVGLDSCSSGPQLMAAMLGCEITALYTGLIDPVNRYDLYREMCIRMNDALGSNYTRKELKNPAMTRFYCSKREPMKAFGEGTPELETFYQCLEQVAPGPSALIDVLENCWQPYALEHSWVMPDGGTVVIPVMDYDDKKIEVDELGHATFTHRVWVNRGKDHYISLPANVIHSCDALVVREVVRRCNYNRQQLVSAQERILQHFMGRNDKNVPPAHFVSLRMIESGDAGLAELSTGELCRLLGLIHELLQRPSFPVLTVHDEFKCHPNYMNWVRQTYVDVVAELADSNVLNDIISQITGKPSRLKKLSTGLGDKIRQSNYALS